MVDFFQCSANVDSDEDVNLMALSAAAQGEDAASKSFQLTVLIQGQHRTFLVDSGSTHSFVDLKVAAELQGVEQCAPIRVNVADGGLLTCKTHIPQLKWSCAGVQFTHHFRVLSLGGL